MHGNSDGQIFALIVMVVAACEVARRPRPDRRDLPPPAADRRRRAAGAARLDEPDHLRLARPAAARSPGTIVIALGFTRLPGARRRAAIGTLAIAAAFVCRGRRRSSRCRTAARSSARSSRRAWDYANTVGVDAQLSILVDPLSVFMMLVVTGVSTLIHLYSVAYMGGDRGYTRFFAYLNFFVFSMLLLVLAGNFLLLIVGWAFVGAASYLLISFWYRRTTATRGGHQGVRHQRRRRRRARARHVLHLQAHRHARLPRDVRRASTTSFSQQRRRPRRRAASCCSSARSRSPPRSRCTPGSRTRWRARRRSPR